MTLSAASKSADDTPGQAMTLAETVVIPEIGQLLEATTIQGLRICLARLEDGGLVAFQADCPHRGVPLCQGVLQGGQLICLDHLWRWQALNGKRHAGGGDGDGCQHDLRTYRLEDGLRDGGGRELRLVAQSESGP